MLRGKSLTGICVPSGVSVQPFGSSIPRDLGPGSVGLTPGSGLSVRFCAQPESEKAGRARVKLIIRTVDVVNRVRIGLLLTRNPRYHLPPWPGKQLEEGAVS